MEHNNDDHQFMAIIKPGTLGEPFENQEFYVGPFNSVEAAMLFGKKHGIRVSVTGLFRPSVIDGGNFIKRAIKS